MKSPNSNLYALFDEVFQMRRDAVAFELPGDDEVSYGTLADQVAQTANALKYLGIGCEDRVMVQVEKSLTNVALYLATIKIGAIYCPLNTAYTGTEVSYFVEDCEPAVFIGEESRAAEFSALEGLVGKGGIQYLSSDEGGAFRELIDSQSFECATEQRTNDDLAAIVYTSGTTGRSKGAMLTHGNLVSNAKTLHRLWGFEEGDVLLHALPIYHVHGLFVALNTAFLNGSKINWLERFDCEQVLAYLPGSTVMMGVPTYYTRLLETEMFDREQCRNMRLFISGSAPLLAETHQEFEVRCGHRILERYGMSETGMITSNPYEPAGDRIAGSVGMALPDVEIRIANDAGQILGVGEIGVLEVRGPNVFSGYWRMEEKTRAEFREDGFFITGDLASIDETGRVTLVGREKDLIISGGLNVYPKEIELEIDALEGVLESAVIGVPHRDFGEAVIAVVVPEKSDGALDAEELISVLKTRLAGFKVPKTIIPIEELPRNAMGKVQKAVLREQYSAHFPNTI